MFLWFFSLLFSCGEIKPKGEIQVKKIELSQGIEDFSGRGKFRVFWVPSSQNLLEVEAYENFVENLEIHQNSEKLEIEEKRPTNQGMGLYNITIFSQKNPKKIQLKDSVEFNVSGQIKNPKIDFILKDNAKFIGTIKTEKTQVEMSQLSIANFRGASKNVFLKIKDTAGIIAPYWQVENMKIEAQNHTYTEIDIKDSLNGLVKNTSKIYYFQNPIKTIKGESKTKIEKK